MVGVTSGGTTKTVHGMAMRLPGIVLEIGHQNDNRGAVGCAALHPIYNEAHQWVLSNGCSPHAYYSPFHDIGFPPC